MNTDIKIQRDRMDAAYQLLMQETTTLEKFEKVRTLIKGLSPKIDTLLASFSQELTKLKKLQKGEIIAFTAEALPETTDEEKKRKKIILLLISYWKDLRSEVKRMMDIYDSQQRDGKTTTQEHVSGFSKMIAFAKGPLGLVTLTAVVIAGVFIYLKSSFVTITIKNLGCSSISPIVELPVSIPGIQLPTESIPDGGQSVVTIPPLTVTVDGTKTGSLTLSVFGTNGDYGLSEGTADVIFDGESLVGKRTVVNLGKTKTHELLIQCQTSSE